MNEWILDLAVLTDLGLRGAIARQVIQMVLDFFFKPRRPRNVHPDRQIDPDLIRRAKDNEYMGRCIRVYSPERARFYVTKLKRPGQHEQ